VTAILLPVLASDKVAGWPKDNNAPRISYVDAGEAFARAWPSDAHFAAYSVPNIERRLTLDAIGCLPNGWPMVLLVIDVDHAWKKEKPTTPEAIEAKRQRIEAWWASELPKLEALAAAHPGAFVHRSRSRGYRIIFRLASPVVIWSVDDKEAWRERYRRELLYLARCFAIVGDPACADITRLYRLPFVVVDGTPTSPAPSGDPAALGVWTHEPSAEGLEHDVSTARLLALSEPKVWGPVLRALTPERGGQEEQGPAPELRPENQDEGRVFKRAASYLAGMSPSIEGAGGDAALWGAALAMVRGFNLGPSTALAMLLRDFNPRCSPPWPRAAIERKCREAAERSTKPWGYLRDAEGGEKGLRNKPSERRQRPASDEGAPMPKPTEAHTGDREHEEGPRSGHRTAIHDERPVVLVDFETGQRIREAEAALAARDDLNLYVRDGRLVSVETRASKRRVLRDDVGSPLARDLSLPALRGMLTDVVRFERMVEKKVEGTEEKIWVRIQCRPHDDIVKGLHQATEWTALRDLVGIARAPFLADLEGEVVTRSGYHEPSGYLLALPPGYGTVDVPEAPTRDDALAALAALRDVLSGFPFASPRDESAALAGVLTLAARPALGGENVPAFVFEANMPAAGKTLLADTIALIGTGALAPKHGFTRDEQEMEKTLGSLAGEARALVCFDNVTETIGGSKLDLALTCNGSFSYRLLGHNRTVQSAWRSVVFFTGNNPTIGGDIGRRLLVCRLNSDVERPAKREGFRYRLPEHARQNRAILAGHALTILRAFCLIPAAQRPRVTPLGSFEAWAQLVAGSLLWLGAADPIEAIADERDEGADPQQMAHAALLENWNRLEKHPRSVLRWTADGITVRSAIDALYPNGAPGEGDSLDDLREAIEVLSRPVPGRPPSVDQLAKALRGLKERPWCGKKLVGKPDRKGFTSWRVASLQASRAGHKKTSPAEDAEDAEDVSSQPKPRARSWSDGEGEHTYPGDRDAYASPKSEGKDPRRSSASSAPEPDSSTPPPVSGVTSGDPDEGDGYRVDPDDDAIDCGPDEEAPSACH
jgi:hypothetical protein